MSPSVLITPTQASWGSSLSLCDGFIFAFKIQLFVPEIEYMKTAQIQLEATC